MKKCPNGHEVSDNVKFCPQCGAEVMESSNMVCKKCGNEQKEGERFCSKCGTPFENITITTTSKPKKSKIAIIASVVVLAIVVVAIGGYLCFFNGDKYGKYSLEGLAKITCQYDRIDSFHDGVAAVYKDDENETFKIGFIDRMGNEVSPCIYDFVEYDCGAYEFHDGLCLVSKEGKFFFINKEGKEVISPNYEYVHAFSEGLAAVSKDGKWGYIDTEGKEVIPLSEKYSGEPFSEGLTAIWENGKFGFADKQGKVVIPCKYVGFYDMQDASSFCEGYAMIVNDKHKWGFINKEGIEVIPRKYDSVQNFSEGLAKVEKNGKYGFVDNQGNEVISCIYDGATYFHEGLVKVEKDGKYGFINKQGKVVVPCIYDDAWDSHDGLARVEKDGKWGFIDKQNNEVIPCIYDDAWDSHDGLAMVKKNDKWGFIDRQGNEVIPCIYDSVFNFSEGLAAVCKDGIWGYVDTKGKSTFDVMSEEAKAQVKEKQRIEQEKREEEERKREEENKPMNRFFKIAQTEDYAWKCFEYQSFDFRLDNTDEVLLYFKPVSNGGGSAFYVSHRRGEKNSWYMGLSGFGQYTVSENFMTMTISSMYGSSSGIRWDDKHLKFLIENDGEEVRLIRIFNPPRRVMDADYNYMNIDKAVYIQISKPMDNPFNG